MGKHKGGKGGIIINVSSVAGLGPVGGYCPIYASTKHALLGFSHCLMEDNNFEMTGVKFIVLCPGATVTPMVKDGIEKMTRFPETLETVGKMFENITVQGPEKVADTLAEALKDQSNGEAIWLSLNGTSQKIEMASYFQH
jgi:15-hydroxyprostaglandin dehydrogenase (NAD)